MKKRILALTLCASLLLSVFAFSPAVFAEETEFIVNESFNQYATNDVPSDLVMNSNSHFIKEYTPGEKGLFVSAERMASALSYTFAEAEKLVVSFEVMTQTKNIKAAVRLTSGGKSFDILKLTNMSAVTTHNGYHIGGYNTSRMNKYDVCVNVAKNSYDVYLNGKKLVGNYPIHNTTLGKITGVSFVSETNDEEKAAIIYDNINVHVGEKPLASYPEKDFNKEVYEEVAVKTRAEIGVNRLLNADFEQTVPFVVTARVNTIEQRKDENGNTNLYIERLNSSDFHIDANGVGGTGDYVIYDFDLKLLDPSTKFSVQLKDVNANYETIASVNTGVIKMGPFAGAVADGKWHHIACVYNFYDKVRDVYFDGELVANDVAVAAAMGSAPDVNILRFYCGKSENPADSPAKFLLDNVRVYENEFPVDDISELKRTITINKNKSTYESDAARKEMLEGYTSVHARSGMVYVNREHTLLKTAPYEKENGRWMLPAAELSEVLGYTFSEADGTVTVNGKVAQADKVETKDGVTYIEDDHYFEALAGKRIWHDEISANSGLIIAGDKVFVAPEDPTVLQKLNHFLFYERPADSKIAEDYKASALKGVHPRVQATTEDFERIKGLVKTDIYMEMWYNYLINKADDLVANPTALIYELRDGVRLLYVSRDALKNMYTLGMAYQLTGEQKYADRAWIDLESVSKFQDWHPEHDIDLGEMCAAVAIGYDWMYHGFTEEQRKVIEDGVYQNGFYDAAMAYQTANGRLRGGIKVHTNHNVVINGGVTMASIAFMDVYPDVCSYTLSGAVKGLDLMLHQYAPSGAWYEGPHYWEYTTQYTTKMLSSLDKVFGTCYNLDKTQGLSTASQYVLNMQSELGIFNYGDGQQTNIYVPEMFWLSEKYDDILSTAVPMTLSEGKFADAEDYTLALLFYNPERNDKSILSSLPIDAYYAGEEVITLRDKWTKEETTLAGIQAGYTSQKNGVTNWHSQLDGGSFIFDSMGVRWAKELGMSPYDLPGAGDYTEFGTHWDLYRARAESHNTIVINPDEDPDHATISKVDVTRYEAKPRGGIAVLDMSDVLRNNAKKAKRGMFFTDDRKSLVIRDEVTLSKADSDVYWFMQTDAAIELVENGAILRHQGRTMRLEYVASTPAEMSITASYPLPTSPVFENDRYDTANRIIIKMPKANGDVNITVKLTPDSLWNPSPLSNYDKAIDSWQIPDGEIPEMPKLDSLTVGGRKVELTESTTIDVAVVESEYTSIPEIVAAANGKQVEVTKGATFDEGAKIKVSDGDLTTIYNINFRVVPAPVQFEGSTSIPIVAVTVSDEPEPQNGAYNVIDGNLNTRWSAMGVEQWIKLELKEESVIDKVAMAFASGNVRSTKIQIMVSTDDINYETIFDGWSCGTTLDHEFFNTGGKNVRYIKIGCDGNTAQGIGGWNSITEIVAVKNN